MAVFLSKITVFFIGFSIGILMAFILMVRKDTFEGFKSLNYTSNRPIHNYVNHYVSWLNKLGLTRIPVNFDEFSYSGNKSYSQFLEFNLLKGSVNVLCVMFVQDPSKVHVAINTWMKHCNTIKLFSMKPVMYLEVTILQPKNSWHYLCDAIRHINENVRDFNWVLFVPDDVFAIPENLRHYVYNLNSEELYYLGNRAYFWNVHYNLAQAGYVLSKGSISVLSNKFSSSTSCQKSGKHWNNGDFFLGKHLSDLGVKPTDTKDEFGRGRFHLFTPAQLLSPGEEQLLNKYWKTSLDPATQGFNCCSPQSITFQGTQRTLIYFYYYLLYNVHVHKEAGMLGNAKSRHYTPSDRVWQRFVMDELGPSTNLSAITDDQYFKLWERKIDSPSSFNEKLKEMFMGKSER